MAFSVNTNLAALYAYNALTKLNIENSKTQLKLATGKRINSVADDTSGFSIGKALESKTAVMKSELNNGNSAKDYLATAETSLEQIGDLFTQISAKYADSQDPAKNRSSIAKDINSLATEIDSILKTTKFNDKNLLAQSDGSALASSDVFDVDGDVTMDFAGNSYLDADTLKTVLEGGTSTVTSTAPVVPRVTGTAFSNKNDVIYTGADTTSTFEVVLGDDTTLSFTVPLTTGETVHDLAYYIQLNCNSGDFRSWSVNFSQIVMSTEDIIINPSTNGREIKSIHTTSGFDVIGLLGLDYGTTTTTTTTGGLMNEDTDTAIAAASDLTTVENNVKNALSRIGNLQQSLDMRTDYLTSSITNNSSSISRLFDADIASEQLKAVKGNILSRVAISMLSQLNNSPQNLLSLFS